MTVEIFRDFLLIALCARRVKFHRSKFHFPLQVLKVHHSLSYPRVLRQFVAHILITFLDDIAMTVNTTQRYVSRRERSNAIDRRRDFIASVYRLITPKSGAISPWNHLTRSWSVGSRYYHKLEIGVSEGRLFRVGLRQQQRGPKGLKTYLARSRPPRAAVPRFLFFFPS